MNEMRFALNSMHTLADSHELTNTVDSNQYTCLGCGKKVHLSTAGGKSVFVHSQDNGNCKSKLYLKNLAKFFIYKSYKNAESYSIKFNQKIRCIKAAKCKFYTMHDCSDYDQFSYDVKALYDSCGMDFQNDEIKADLILYDSKGKIRTPILIRIAIHGVLPIPNYKYKVIDIELLEEDAVAGLEGEITESNDVENPENGTIVKFHNFQRKTNSDRQLDNRMFYRFIYYYSGRADCTDLENLLSCQDRERVLDNQSVIELNIPFSFNDPLKLGYAYLQSKKIKIRTCLFCKYYKKTGEEYICTLHKKYELREKPDIMDARGCQHYYLDKAVLNECMQVNSYYGIEKVKWPQNL